MPARKFVHDIKTICRRVTTISIFHAKLFRIERGKKLNHFSFSSAQLQRHKCMLLRHFSHVSDDEHFSVIRLFSGPTQKIKSNIRQGYRGCLLPCKGLFEIIFLFYFLFYFLNKNNEIHSFNTVFKNMF